MLWDTKTSAVVCHVLFLSDQKSSIALMVDSEPEMLLNHVYGIDLEPELLIRLLLLRFALAVLSLLFSPHDGGSAKMGLDVV